MVMLPRFCKLGTDTTTMRFKKGSRVEVLNQTDMPSGSWQCGEIVCGNGHYYTVRYDWRANDGNDGVVERVSRNAIRLCPPTLEVLENWAVGDVLEVFHDFSWKMATVSKVLGRKKLMVRLICSAQEILVDSFDLRRRLSRQADYRIVIGKGFGSCEDRKHNYRSTMCDVCSSSQDKEADMRIKLRVKNGGLAVDKNTNLQDSHFISSRIPKRRSPSSAGAPQKFRATKKQGKINRMVAVNPSSLPEKVDAVVSFGEMLDDKYMHTSFMSRKTGLSEIDLERGKSNGAVGCSHAIGLEPIDAESVSCSVGSCSITSHIPYKLGHHCSTDRIADTDSQCSDAESFCGRYYEEENSFLSTKEELEAEIHKLELHAYRSTIEALHASGPLNWEKETMVTNLRLLLHISNDEHLMELRRLGANIFFLWAFYVDFSADVLAPCCINDFMLFQGPKGVKIWFILLPPIHQIVKNAIRTKKVACLPCFQMSKDDVGICQLTLGVDNGAMPASD
ncbi:ENT domain [Dillenia turbinata]|uniref:ENT domain n=1 Tax=Dillenia turbinata TaxID=194707 RepID=A0AAN8ZPN1_9MAGN